jgi:predicted transposase YbfD/YdcC
VPAGSVSPVSSVAEALDHWRAGDRVDLLRSELLDVLAAVRDPRDPRGRRYPLAALLAIAILATAAGMRGYAGFATWARTVPEDVLSQLGIRFRRPSEKTFRSALQRLDPADLDRQLGAYFTAVAAAQATQSGLLVVALDGKTLRGARRAGAAAAHLVSVFAHHARLVLGQLAVAEKSNEIPCVRKLLKLFRQVRLLVTVDAMHTQTATAKLICSTLKSHYLMIVKSNQPTLLARIQALPWAEVPVTATDDDHGHGRIERRTLQILTAARGIGFPYAKQVVRITRERLVSATGARTVEVVYAICSLPFEQARPAMIATWLRQHWGIENRVH